ncbi:MAG: hypothetical protein H6815_11915 [Phycisphaeraceae bacterium]|nr:hypothetical protein [Phycisphaeraceae bacterium]
MVDWQLANLLLRDAQGDSPLAGDALTSLYAMVGMRRGSEQDLDTIAKWMETSRLLSEPQWYAEVAENHARTARARAVDVNNALTELIASYRMSYDLLKDSPEKRPELLLRLIEHDRSEVREFGYTLAERELQAARQLGDAFNKRVAAQLVHPSATTRMLAARLLPRLGFDDGGAALAEGLARETDPNVAAAMLEAVAQRWKVSMMAPYVVRWIAEPSPARMAAFDAARALIDASAMTDDSQIDAIRLALFHVRSSLPTPTTAALIVSLGTDEDVQSLVNHLASLADASASQLDARRNFALLAPIVCVRPECADILRNAAKTMPEVSPSAARAISLAFESDEAARIIASLSFQSSRAKQVALAPVLEPLPDAACAEVVADLDAETKIPLLRTLLARPSVGGLDAANEFAISIHVQLAEALLHQRDPQAALDTIMDLSPADDSAHRDTLVAARARAQLALGNTDEVIRMGVPPELWLMGLREAYWVRRSDVLHIVDVINNRFEKPELTPAQWNEVAFYGYMSVQSQLPPQPTPETNNEPVPVSPPGT